jgi:hypothetical protein
MAATASQAALAVNFPKAWQVNVGWVIAVGLTAWPSLLGHCYNPDMRQASPDTLRSTGSGTSPLASPGMSASGP